jgi:isoleucyl-tRNA synthetase
MTWCKDCATALAKHELEYETVTDTSIFVKFPIIGRENEFLVIWTTTPWTIPFNLGVMANPDLDYVKAEVEGESWILAKPLAGTFIRGVVGKDFTIKEEMKGSALEGIKYRHPFYDELKEVYDEIIKKSDKAFSVVLSEEFVDTSAGSGLVHMAPGCGPEDYEVGHRNEIPAFNNLDEFGKFPDEMGKFAGMVAKDDDRRFIEALKEKGAVVAETPVEHEYAHCWRCHKPIIYRTTKQWFFKVEDIKEGMRKLNQEIYWVPDYAGSRQFDSWLANLKDNCLTRQRAGELLSLSGDCDKCGE